MRVLKRNGKYENVNFNKIEARIKKICKLNHLKKIDSNEITQQVISFLKNDISTKELDEITSRLLTSTINYESHILANNIIISNNHKNTNRLFSEKIKYLNEHKRINDTVAEIVKNNTDFFNNLIDYTKDFLLDYFGFKTLEKNYLMHVNGKIVETPQDMFMRVCIALYDNDLDEIKNNYELMSNLYFTHATPTLFNAGTNKQQFASCFLLQMEDSIDGIFKCIADCGKISKWGGGIGIGLSDVRCKGAVINGTNGITSGIIPICKILNETALYVNQGGKRNGSFAIYLEPHHSDFLNFIELRKNHGDEFARARDIFLAVWISDLFMERVRNKEMWSFMNPDISKNLTNLHGKEYRELYEQYEREGKYVSQKPARLIMEEIIKSQIETGMPYVMNKDIVNACSNQKNLGTIKSSNLCSEITLYSSPEEYAVCTLASISLSSCIENKKFNYNLLSKITRRLVLNLNKIIDKNFYPVPEAQLSNLKHRPLGIGVQGFAETLMKLKIQFDSDEAKDINKKIYETMYYSALFESNLLAQKDGVYETYEGSPLSQGIFHFELHDNYTSNKTELSGMWDFEELRENIKKYGVRNSTLISLMPTASTSQILGNTESFEPMTSNIYTRSTISGDFVILNKFLLKDLENLGLWNETLKNEIINNNGSVQEINNIPQEIKNIYKTVWDIKQKFLIDLSAERTPFICQSQSLNLYFPNVSQQKIFNALMYGHKMGLKTMVYYCRTTALSSSTKFTTENCESCSG